MSMYTASVPQFQKTLRLVLTWLDAAEAHAKQRGYDPDLLASTRLAPDMYPLTRQIGAACDAAKFAAAYLAGIDPPRHPDTETTLAELRARLDAVIAWLEGISEAQFEGAKARAVALPFLGGRTLAAPDYLNQLAIPNFYFHVTTTYALLRHAGVPIGKRDFIGSLPLLPA